jgi:hypothetical protein
MAVALSVVSAIDKVGPKTAPDTCLVTERLATPVPASDAALAGGLVAPTPANAAISTAETKTTCGLTGSDLTARVNLVITPSLPHYRRIVISRLLIASRIYPRSVIGGRLISCR